MTKQAENDSIVALAQSQFGRVDAIFLNAGLMPLSPLSALKTEDWHQMVDVNVKGVLNGVAAVLPAFLKQRGGHVIATSSVAGLKAYPGGAVYGGTKWFVRDFMEVLRMESAMEGSSIRTATIYPAAINTELPLPRPAGASSPHPCQSVPPQSRIEKAFTTSRRLATTGHESR